MKGLKGHIPKERAHASVLVTFLDVYVNVWAKQNATFVKEFKQSGMMRDHSLPGETRRGHMAHPCV